MSETVNGIEYVMPRLTIIHHGSEINLDVELELLEAARLFTDAAADGAAHAIDVWAVPGSRMVGSCLATVFAFGAPVCTVRLPGTDELVAKMKACGYTVRHRHGRKTSVENAELRALCQGWPIRYI